MRTSMKSLKALHMFVCLFAIMLIICAGEVNAHNFASDKFLNISPFPGDEWALDSDGNIIGNGAFQINIPVAYTPKNGYVMAFGSFGSTREKDGSKDMFDNGIAVLGGSIGNRPRVWVSLMAYHYIDITPNVQVQFVKESKNTPAISAGVQAIRSINGDRLYFMTATKDLSQGRKKIYATLGLRENNHGDLRGMGGISVPINDYVSAAMEWGGVQLNSGILVRPGGLNSDFSVMGGYNGQTGWLVGASARFKLSSFGIK